jgi:hypothetical protein
VAHRWVLLLRTVLERDGMKGRTRIQRGAGLLAFVICLLLMPVGHALMVLNEHVVHGGKFIGAVVLGVLGMGLLILGAVGRSKAAVATLLGLLGGILVWTGWVEFSFVWVAEKLSVAPHMQNGEVATKPEYLVMLSSLGLLGSILLMLVLGPTRCQFFVWFQRRLGMRSVLKRAASQPPTRPIAVTAFMETVVIIWTFYIVLLLAYDPDIAGDHHPVTYFIAFGSLAWSAYLFAKLLRIKSFDQAIRYAIPTVVIFWNFVEIAGRWNLFTEIWVHPVDHWLENTAILGILAVAVALYVLDGRRDRKSQTLVPV